MKTFGERLRQARKEAKLTQKTLADKVGITKSAISQAELGLSKGLSHTSLVRACRAMDVSPEWLSFGKGEMHPFQPPLQRVKELRPAEHTQPTGNTESNVSPGPPIRGRVPLISWVQAGEFCEIVDLFEPGDAEEWLPCPTAHSDRTYALRINGDSMTSPYPGQRSYPPGVIVFVDPDREVTNGCRVIAKLEGDVTFKTYSEDMGRRYLRPINPTWKTQDITDLPVAICGVVIGSYMPE
ncbi:LexA family transcriptional regulator [Microbulbifer sp. 2205BS26-8]|uniref:LexA family protein n=1 Tax=Microbulbifer sp. 2205BS26-8 TaxID=3064386 RepID=UPI00273E6986|nr:XRE family transcriptional regulator [Microbulbifer sp. 2205BS26-8]MDP5211186.1 XRE family transcriptional regulator [Microbulbifer sp. 2205BS26-8]